MPHRHWSRVTRELPFPAIVVATCLVLLRPNLTLSVEPAAATSDTWSDRVHPLLQQHCVTCHGEDGNAEADVDLLKFQSAAELIAQPELIGKLIDVIDLGQMPPEGEGELTTANRAELVTHLKPLLRQAMNQTRDEVRTPIRRMNRFQYSNAVQDLFDLNVEVFPLPERMLREYDDYFQPATGRMPDAVKVGNRPLGKSQLIERCLGGVTAFPQDLRAEHGFDNRADHLTLSPLLLESFLRLARSIVESLDFNERTCGIWRDFFAPPPSEDAAAVTIVEERLRLFLGRAFRRPVDDDVLKRYSHFVSARLKTGEPFVDAMKSAAAAAIASPQFFYLYDTAGDDDTPESLPDAGLDDFSLASRLSFFLWGSIPDDTLLTAAAKGQLSTNVGLKAQVDRMLLDERLKRFCDSFPAQWMQLDRLISSEPDPELFPQFYLGPYRVSMHMMLEPLLLFETVLIEDRSLLEFIDADYSYRSELLESWYRDGTRGNAGSPTTLAFRRVPITDRRQGGLITNAAVLTMNAGTVRTKPITRGAWLATVILNDPPPPPPGDVLPLPDQADAADEHLTLRERFAAHRSQTACAGCHQRIDPLGFALENYDATGLWRETYENGREVDASGTLFGKHPFADVVEFKDALLAEKLRFTRALAGHLLSFATGRELGIEDAHALDQITSQTANEDYRFQALIRHVVLSERFRLSKPIRKER